MNKKYAAPFFPFLAGYLILSSLQVLVVHAQHTDEYTLKTVVIDPGHGGKDPGSPGKLTFEKHVVLAIALKLGAYIETQMPGVKVIYTRKTDEFIPLYKRAEIANTNKADLFISIHANGNTNTAVFGTETLVLGLHRAGENFEVAKRENGVIQLEDDYHTRYEGYDPNSPESFIMFSLMQNLYFEQSINLAALVEDQFRVRAGRNDRGVKQQGLLVLAQTSMPGILIETGFITNPDEEKFLMSEQGQDYIASAIFRAFRDYKRITESKTSFALAARGTKPATDSNSSDTGKVIEKETEKPVVPPSNRSSAVVFKVQITASSKPIPEGSKVFKGLTDVSQYKVGNMYKYAVGSSATFQDIIIYSRKIKEKFPDAFIIAVKDTAVIPLDQALQETQQKNSN